MRYRLSTLLIVLALGPPLSAGIWLARRDVLAALEVELNVAIATIVLGAVTLWTLGVFAALTVEAVEVVRARLQNRR